jgi:hypothetical protein
VAAQCRGACHAPSCCRAGLLQASTCPPSSSEGRSLREACAPQARRPIPALPPVRPPPCVTLTGATAQPERSRTGLASPCWRSPPPKDCRIFAALPPRPSWTLGTRFTLSLSNGCSLGYEARDLRSPWPSKPLAKEAWRSRFSEGGSVVKQLCLPPVPSPPEKEYNWEATGHARDPAVHCLGGRPCLSPVTVPHPRNPTADNHGHKRNPPKDGNWMTCPRFPEIARRLVGRLRRRRCSKQWQ